MSWQASQDFQQNGRRRGGQHPIPHMMAAAAMASNKVLAQTVLEQIQAALAAQLQAIPADIDWQAFQNGLTRYTTTQATPARPVYAVLAQQGRVTLCDAGGEGPVVVLVPSMVNRGYVLDLCPGFSLVEFLRDSGFRVLLVDWGDPAAGDSPLTLETVVAARLEPLLRTAAEQNGGPVAVLGYCMGGLLAVAAAARLGQAVVGKLAVAAMPWDFSITTSASHMQQVRGWLQPWLESQPVLPPAALAQYFWGLDPWGPIRRISAYGTETDPARLAHMTALEDWLADGIGIDSPIAQEMLLGWYADNTALKGAWQVQGTPIRPQDLTMPLWVAITQNDALVPLASSLPFVGQTKGAQVHMAATGHVGLVCGRKARSAFYEPLVGWLKGV